MRHRPVRVALFVSSLLALAVSPCARADPRLPAVLSDHMVLQRDAPVPIWGSADPGEVVRVEIDGARAEAVTDADGRWSATLPPLPAGGPFDLTVRGAAEVVVHDVSIGEVWICSGQSNMNFSLADTDTAARDVPAATDPALRLFTVARRATLAATGDTTGAWMESTPATAGAFSAVAYYFGRDLRASLGVPVGLVQASWSGSAGEEWVDRATLEHDPILRPIVERWQRVPDADKAMFRRAASVAIEIGDVELVLADGTIMSVPDFGDADGRIRSSAWRFEAGGAPGIAIRLTRGPGGNGTAARVAGRMAPGDLALLRMAFRPSHAPIDLSGARALRVWARGRGALRLHLLQPTITDWDHYASTTRVVGRNWTAITLPFDSLRQEGWGRRVPLTLDAVSGLLLQAAPRQVPTVRPPAGLFNGMIRPVAPFGIRGVVWYQGESNTARAVQYRRLLPAVVGAFRGAFRRGDIPFGIVQLASYGQRSPEPHESRWAELREAQLFTSRTVPNTGLVVAIDQGDADDIHPKHKLEVGRRLAGWALATVYGKDVRYVGPVYDAIEVEGDRVRVRFGSGGGRLATRDGGPVRGFAVAGDDRRFHAAEASIDGATVVVRSADVPAPVAARYAWAGNPDATLTNDAGLPASPFRSDDWPLTTAAAR